MQIADRKLASARFLHKQDTTTTTTETSGHLKALFREKHARALSKVLAVLCINSTIWEPRLGHTEFSLGFEVEARSNRMPIAIAIGGPSITRTPFKFILNLSYHWTTTTTNSSCHRETQIDEPSTQIDSSVVA